MSAPAFTPHWVGEIKHPDEVHLAFFHLDFALLLVNHYIILQLFLIMSIFSCQHRYKDRVNTSFNISCFTPPITMFCLPCRYIFDILGLNFIDTPDDCSVLCTYMKRFVEWISVLLSIMYIMWKSKDIRIKFRV